MEIEAPDEIDQLYDSLHKPDSEIPMSGEAPAAVEPVAQEPVWNGAEWEFEANGKKIAPDSRDKARTWMSQGYNYAQRMGEINKQRSEWERKQAEYDAKIKGYSRFDEVDKYARENPQWWDHVESSWNTRQIPQGANNDLAPVLQPIQEKLGKFEEFIGQMQAERLEAQEQQANDALESEVSEIRKSYPNIDLASIDESGKPLELRVLEHCREIGTSSFRAGFRDYLFDKLQTMGSANAKEAAVKQGQAQAKRGIIAQSATPARQPAPYSKGKSYDQLTREALAELGIS